MFLFSVMVQMDGLNSIPPHTQHYNKSSEHSNSSHLARNFTLVVYLIPKKLLYAYCLSAHLSPRKLKKKSLIITLGMAITYFFNPMSRQWLTLPTFFVFFSTSILPKKKKRRDEGRGLRQVETTNCGPALHRSSGINQKDCETWPLGGRSRYRGSRDHCRR